MESDKFKRMNLVEFVSTLGSLVRGTDYLLLSQWDRVAFLWMPLPLGGAGFPVEVLVAADWLPVEMLGVVDLPTIPVERLRRNRTRAWDIIEEQGCLLVTFHGRPEAIMVKFPPDGAGWDPVDIAAVVDGTKTIEEVVDGQ